MILLLSISIKSNEVRLVSGGIICDNLNNGTWTIVLVEYIRAEN